LHTIRRELRGVESLLPSFHSSWFGESESSERRRRVGDTKEFADRDFFEYSWYTFDPTVPCVDLALGFMDSDTDDLGISSIFMEFVVAPDDHN
jgi:hypothetical protein